MLDGLKCNFLSKGRHTETDLSFSSHNAWLGNKCNDLSNKRIQYFNINRIFKGVVRRKKENPRHLLRTRTKG